MDSYSYSIKRRQSGSDSLTIENSKKLKINRTFGNAQVDGHHDHDGDVVDDVFFAENQPLPGWREQPQ